MNIGNGKSIPAEMHLKNQSFWIPVTPIKPVTTKARGIYTERQGNQPGGGNCSEIGIFPGGISQETEAQITEAWPRNQMELDRDFNNWEPDLARTNQFSQGIPGNYFDGTTEHNNSRLTFLADMASRESLSEIVQGKFNKLESPSGYSLTSHAEGECRAPASMLVHHHFFGPGICMETPQFGHPTLYRPIDDYNTQPWAVANPHNGSSMSAHFVPVTPDQVKRVENNQIPEIAKERTSHDKIADTTRDEVNNISCENELWQPITTDKEVENHNPDKGANNGLDLNKTPQQKPRRKRHRPKVITEGKPRPRKQAIPKSNSSEATPRVKRKYVRRKALNKPSEGGASTNNTTEQTVDPRPGSGPEPTAKSCRRALNFDLGADSNSESQVQNGCIGVQSKSTTEVGITFDLNLDHVDYVSIPETQAASTLSETTVVENGAERKDVGVPLAPRSPDDSNCSTTACLKEVEQTGGLKRQRSRTTKRADFGSMKVMRIQFHPPDTHSCMFGGEDEFKGSGIPGMLFPEICKKKRTEKGQNSNPSSTLSSPTPEEIGAREGNANPFGSKNISSWTSKVDQERQEALPSMLAFGQSETLTRKRSKGTTRIRENMCSLSGIAEGKLPNYPYKEASGEMLNNPPTCVASLIEETHLKITTKKRTKKRNTQASLASSSVSCVASTGYPPELVYPPKLVRNNSLTVNMIVEQFKHLDINRESSGIAYQDQNAIVPYNIRNQEQHAIVLYGRDGTVVPFGGTIRKRRPRPKVELDEETTRVWKLLLENINSEGIDGTDEDKAKWWEEERRVFRGRADSFIARMHLVQGDRRFSQWKGSVIDSVVGVFLTQNVSDHLSSSAFMSLAAHFPLKSTNNHNLSQEVSIVDSQDTIRWSEVPGRPPCDQTSMMLQNIDNNNEKEVVNSNDLSGTTSGDFDPVDNLKGQIIDSCESGVQEEAALSQKTDVPPQHFLAERIASCSDSNSEVEDLVFVSNPGSFNSSDSFVGLLNMMGTNMLNDMSSTRINNLPFSKNPMNQLNQEGIELDEQGQDIERIMPPSSDRLDVTATGLETLEVECLLGEESRSSDIYNKKNEDCTSDQSGLTAESTSQATVEKKLTLTVEDEPKFSMKINFSCNNSQGESSNVLNSQKIIGNKGVDLKAETNAENVKPKRGRRVAKETKKVDWDDLRKQAHATNGRREKTTNTMDSIDWEAVRCADVSEIANTIKERGMNNMLAERIKDFLNRLVRDHGELDLEWLRDVPPDKAKEYLLSIRGLGLKSVECVRLLTLHHLAFPVDTNVGRIAVRLGWVPLQPLPESLQLHLLELYPVLESIQKYLWPRLCKLDQRTLYELHYQMITFGKVFCTKSKPNCNSCPMRGECRHFASAFASARLALPGLEERGIVSVTENREPEQDVSINPFPPLLLPQGNQESVAKSGICNSEPIVEVPATPEPECTQIAENDIEDAVIYEENPDEIPTIKLNIEAFTQNLQNYVQQSMELQAGDLSKALVALNPEAASIPVPKLKNISRLRTEHQVYELPDTHPLLEGLDKRETDDPCSYLLAIWTPGETANSVEPPERKCCAQEYGNLCNEKTCLACNSIREANTQTVRGTLLIPCRTAMRGSFPLNGTYFQVNEVFADHESSLNPIDVPRAWIWNLPRRTVYFGTSIPTIFKGLSTEGIQYCFWRGFVCVRGFDQKTRAPRPLMARLHFPASKLVKTRGKTNDD